MTQRITIEVDQSLKEKIIYAYSPFQVENNGEYIEFFARTDTLVVTVYNSKKSGNFKVVFVGKNALNEARKFDDEASLVKKTKKTKTPTKASWILLEDQIGSDEVGTGDFFGPICVCAAFIKNSDIKRLKKLGVDDSKRLTDDKIRELGKILISEFQYSQVSLNNEKYNELVDRGMNMNEMKSKMHNQVLLNLQKKNPDVSNFVIDQFLEEKNYYKYIKNEEQIVQNITFKTKGESYFPSVAVGSIIARYSFITKMDQLSEKYGVKIPYGASKKVDDFAKKFVEKYGFDELDKIVKKNFANYKKLSELNL